MVLKASPRLLPPAINYLCSLTRNFAYNATTFIVQLDIPPPVASHLVPLLRATVLLVFECKRVIAVSDIVKPCSRQCFVSWFSYVMMFAGGGG